MDEQSRNVAAVLLPGCNGADNLLMSALVAQPGRALLNDYHNERNQRGALGGIRARDLYLNGIRLLLDQ